MKSVAPSQVGRLHRERAVKVPEATALFWVTKVLTTGMGETTSDYLAHRYNPYLAATLGGAAFVAALAWQLKVTRYRPGVYWLAVVMVSVFGTMAADGLHVQLGVPYAVSTAFYIVVLIAVFFGWWRLEGTLSIHSITTLRRELFYWAAVLTTFALGTALGDLTAITGNWGYFRSGLVFAVMIAIPAAAYYVRRSHAVLAFWAAYVVTRPLGASFADWIGVSRARGGLGFGTAQISILLAVAIIGFVIAGSLGTAPPEIEVSIGDEDS